MFTNIIQETRDRQKELQQQADRDRLIRDAAGKHQQSSRKDQLLGRLQSFINPVWEKTSPAAGR